MAPGGYYCQVEGTATPLYYDSATTWTCSGNCTWWIDSSEAAKLARIAWQRFIIGDPFSEYLSAAGRRFAQIIHAHLFIPGLRESRRQRRTTRWFSLKALKRLGVI